MNRKDILWLYVYMIAGIVDLSLIAQNLSDYRLFSKPIILLSLIIYFIKGSQLIQGSFLRKAVSAALVFSLAGDILMMFPSLFLYGLGAYFISFTCYIFAFKLSQGLAVNFSGFYIIRLFLYNLPFYFLTAILYFLIHYQLGTMKTPVIIYLCAMVIMVTTARERFKKTNPASFWQVMIGSFLFFTSQGIYLVDLFFRPLADADILVMGTYLLAQLLIVMGLRSHFLDVLNKKLMGSGDATCKSRHQKPNKGRL
jgi:uncharacterized membrane protein YhhN